MGEFVKTQNTDHILYLGLDRGRSNALHLEMVQELIQELEKAKNDPAVEGIVLHGKDGFFSSGLDLITLYDYNQEEIKSFWNVFMELVYNLSAFPKPTTASITGHSPAGGCVLALCCDYRVMAEGEFIIGLNEVPVGIVVPSSIFELYSFWIGKAQAYRNLLEGRLLKPAEAHNCGLVDETVPANRVLTAAARKAKAYAQYDKTAWSTTKLNLRAELLTQLESNKSSAINQVLEQWWKPSTRQILETIIGNLTAKKA